MNDKSQLLHAVLISRLASSSVGRIALHTFCLIRRPGRVRWHWNGIVRELAQFRFPSIGLVTFPNNARRRGMNA